LRRSRFCPPSTIKNVLFWSKSQAAHGNLSTLHDDFPPEFAKSFVIISADEYPVNRKGLGWVVLSSYKSLALEISLRARRVERNEGIS
jgi:hypothetical protein